MKKITLFFLFLFHLVQVLGQEVTIGTGTATIRQPLSNWYGFERSAALYTAAEIGRTGYINEIAWSIGTTKPTRPIKIYLKEVDATSLTAANWNTFIQGATLMYDGPFTSAGLGFNFIAFDESFPFLDRTKSLLVLVEANAGGGGNGAGVDGFKVAATSIAAMHFTAARDNAIPTEYLSSSSNRPNVKLTFGQQVTCFAPTNLQAEFIGRTADVRLSWTPRGEERAWEVYTTLQGQAAPSDTTRGILVENTPALLVEEVEEGAFFEFYVRAICQDASGQTKTKWSGPLPYSYFIPPMCANLDGGVEGLPPSATDTYYICEEGPVAHRLAVQYVDIKKTDQYRVEAIEYDPPFPFFGGNGIALTADDIWSDIIHLGFDFCFYGKQYNKALVSTNGALSFSIKNEVPGGMYTPNTFSAWEFNQALPSLPTGTSMGPFTQAVFGVYQDLYPATSPEDYSFNYQVLGTYPCRALVVNMYHMGLFNVPFNPNDIEGSTQTSQIVLYEGTNIIDVYVKNRPVNRNHNSGNGLIGIQGGTRTQFQVPPGRNTGAWTTTNEAWRFIPDGESSVNFQWYKNGMPFSREEVIDVIITEDVNYTAKAMYQNCEGEDFVMERSFNFIKEDFQVNDLPNYVVCGSVKDPQGQVSMNIAQHKDRIFEALEEDSVRKYAIAYYEDEELTQEMPDSIEVKRSTTVYVKVTNLKTKCVKVATFEAIRTAPIQVTKLNAVYACESYVLPELKEGEYYYSEEDGQGTRYQAGEIYTVIGDSTLYIYTVGERGCDGESSFQLTIYEPIIADHIDNQWIYCQNYVLPSLSPGNSYHTEPQGKGLELKEGEVIIEPITLYIYAKRGGNDTFCWDESSFTISFQDCPIPKGISPNGDGLNDTLDLSAYGIAKIQIFNRSGIEVYTHGLGYTNQWEGQDKSGNKLPSGTYYYVIVSHGKLKTGWVQLNY